MADDSLSEYVCPSGRSVAPSSLPDPSPDTVERAQKIINRLKEGEAFSTLGDDAPLTETSDATSDISAQEKLDFLAYLLGNVPIAKTFRYFGGRLVVVFSTISAVTERILSDLVLEDERIHGASKESRSIRYRNYMLAASLREYEIDGDKVRLEVFAPSNDLAGHRSAFNTWFSELSHELNRLLQRAYHDYRARIAYLMGKAEDQDFWPAPS